jgi:hypothetical protein
LMPEAARERGYKPRPQAPHSLHRSAVTGRRPSIERDSLQYVTEMGTKVKGNYILDKYEKSIYC